MASSAQYALATNIITEIADFLGNPVVAANFPDHVLRFRNDRAAASIGLDSLNDDRWIDHFGRFVAIPASLAQPLALRYHGHQFRVYNPDIGDGRGFLFAQMHDHEGRVLDLGTKGSGQTPYSRFGDGRLTLKGAVREILATEMLEALGVQTSKTLSVIETGESLHRGDEPSPTRSAVLVRLSHGHIRIGSFQRLATLGLTDELARLVGYTLHHYFDDNSNDPVALMRHVASRTARLAASYMAAGFVHGVLNTDNINVTGESFDYGPWRFAPTFDVQFTAAYFDQNGLYAFGRQAEAIHWNLVQLGSSLRSLADTQALAEAIDSYVPAYYDALTACFLWRLGVQPKGREDDLNLVRAIESHLIETQINIDDFFFESVRNPHPLLNGYDQIIDRHHPYWQRETPTKMLINDVESIWTPIAEHDNWERLNAKITEIRQMRDAMAAR